jgi:hypothetical protein
MKALYQLCGISTFTGLLCKTFLNHIKKGKKIKSTEFLIKTILIISFQVIFIVIYTLKVKRKMNK